MPIVTISRGSYSMGKAVAKKVAERLGYECLSRDVLLEASDRYNTSAIKLEQAIHDAPGWFDRFHHEKMAYIAYIQASLTKHVSRDNVVYHGLAGHLLLKNVSHVLKVRIVADMDWRIRIVTERARCSDSQAAAQITKLDSQRRRWTHDLYGVDPSDPQLYDLMLNLPRLSTDDATDLICHVTKRKQFQTTSDSQQEMKDLALACVVKAALFDRHSDIAVSCTYGNVVVYCAAGDRHERKVKASADELCGSMDAISHLEVHAGVSPPTSAV
jgi:cytidylate kinase